MTTPQWQRLRFMTCKPLYEDQPWVTASQAHRDLARSAALEGMVLLKNEESMLPFAAGQKIAVFGKAQADYVKGGGGSGDVTVSYVRTLSDGLAEKEREGKISVFAPLTDFYAENVAQQYAQGKTPGNTVEPPVPEELLAQARAFTDVAIVSICRFSGEGYDRTGEAFDGDFFLSREEDAMIRQVAAVFNRIVITLNVGGMMDTMWFKDDPRMKAVLLAGQAGMEGGLAMADLLCGDACPSGHLTDTLAVDFAAYPSSAGFNESEDYVAYEDDIYVGYRYFQTVPGAAEKVTYPFGFGLSYTTFDVADAAVKNEGDHFILTARVTNTGPMAGRYVLQAYASAPQGKLGKPARVLVGFVKTALLEPGETETASVRFTAYDMASYDDLGKVAASAYVLEKGVYAFYCGDNVRDAKKIKDTWTVEEDRILAQHSAKCVPHLLTRRLRSDGSYEPLPVDGVDTPRMDQHYPGEGEAPMEWSEKAPFSAWEPPTTPQLADVAAGKLSMEDFLAALTPEHLVHLLGGQPNRGGANTFGFGNLPVYGVPNVMTADGPAGLRFKPETGVTTTAFPCASQIACSWNVELAYAIGRAGAEEVLENGVGVWLTPAINIHRSPLCGRNFEYYSEDPLLTGKMASGMIQGIQSMKVAVSLKHFACNNKETNRKDSDSRLSERALREIYIKGFEICVKEADPWSIMSSYNVINGRRASQNKELLTDILRGEWDFHGAVTSDWCTHGEHWMEIAAGNDIKMPCGDEAYTLQMLREGKLNVEDVKTSARRVLELLLKLA